MINVIKKHLSAAAVLGALVLAAALPMLALGPVAVAAEQPGDLQAQGMAALKVYWTAIVAGTPQALDLVLAPEYQLQRADGSGYAKPEYLKTELPKFVVMPEFTKVSVTGTADLLVVRYYVTVDSTRGGKKVQKHAPRLTVFRRQGDTWLVVAHANFATLEK